MRYDPNGYPEISVPDLGRVFQVIRDGNCIPFFGAGASMDYSFNGASAPGVPGGWELTLSLLRAAHVATDAQIAALRDPASADHAALREAMKLQGYDLFKAADSFLYSRANNRSELDQFLRNEVAKARIPRPIHSVIAQVLDIDTVVTTNYDCLFETACHEYHRQVFKHVHEQFRADTGIWTCNYKLRPPQILFHKMHGCKDLNESMVITRGDYIRYLANCKDPAKGMPSAVANRLNAATLLFLGYGLGDWNFLTIWEGRICTNAQFGKGTRSFAVMKAVSPENRDFLRDRNIELIECDLTHFAIAIAREFKLKIPQLEIPKKDAGGAA